MGHFRDGLPDRLSSVYVRNYELISNLYKIKTPMASSVIHVHCIAEGYGVEHVSFVMRIIS
jgi:hypothetical protein